MGRGISLLMPVFTSALLVSSAASGQQPGSLSIADPGFYEPPADLTGFERGDVIRWEPEPDMHPGMFGMIDVYRLMYRSIGAKGDAIAATGYLLVHKTAAAPVDGWDIVAWTHGTAGVGDACAPSKYYDLWPEFQWLGYAMPPRDLVNAGFLVVAPDFEGMGTPGIASYGHGPAMGHATIDAVRAARALAAQLGHPSSGEFAVLGHSQGAVAARASNVLAGPEAQDLVFRASVEVGSLIPSADELLDLIHEASTTEVFPYIGYIAASIRALDPDFDYSRMVGPQMFARMGDAETTCFDAWFESWFLQEVTPAGILNPGFASDPDVREMAEAWAFGGNGEGSSGPALVIFGDRDEIFSPERQQTAREGLCASGGTVANFITYEGQSHDGSLAHGLPAAIGWLVDRFEGVPVDDDCP